MPSASHQPEASVCSFSCLIVTCFAISERQHASNFEREKSRKSSSCRSRSTEAITSSIIHSFPSAPSSYQLRIDSARESRFITFRATFTVENEIDDVELCSLSSVVIESQSLIWEMSRRRRQWQEIIGTCKPELC